MYECINSNLWINSCDSEFQSYFKESNRSTDKYLSFYDTYTDMFDRFAFIVIFKHHIVHPKVTVIDHVEIVLVKLADFRSLFIYMVGEFFNLFGISSDKNNASVKLIFIVIINKYLFTVTFFFYFSFDASRLI